MTMKQNLQQTVINIIKYGLIGFLSLIILINFYMGLGKAHSKQPVPKFLGISPLIVLSGSMQPAILPGDVVVIREVEKADYKIGDIATYLEGNTAFTHRIIAEEDGMFILKGDNNNIADDGIAPDKLLGKVVLRIPQIGLAILFFKTLPGMMILIALVLICIYGEEVWERIPKRR